MITAIRQGMEGDVQALCKLGKTTFYETWNSISNEEDIQLYLSETYSEETILRNLKSNNNIYYVIEDGSGLIGFVKLRHSAEIPEAVKNFKCLEVAQIYVDKNYHDKKVGAALMNHTLRHAADNGFELIWLSTWEDNLRAMTFYRKFGFEKFSKHNFIMGNKIYEDVLMKKVI